jgi:hypothetical protein
MSVCPACLARARGPGRLGLGLRPARVIVGGAGRPARGGPLRLRGTGRRQRASAAAAQRRGEAFAALLGDIAVPDMTGRWPMVEQWSRQVPLLAGGQSR